MVFIEDPLRQGGYLRREILEGVEHHVDGGVIGIFLIRFSHRGVNIVAAELVHLQPFGFHLEEALEQAGVLLGDLQQCRDDLIGDVVIQVADGDGRLEAA